MSYILFWLFGGLVYVNVDVMDVKGDFFVLFAGLLTYASMFVGWVASFVLVIGSMDISEWF